MISSRDISWKSFTLYLMSLLRTTFENECSKDLKILKKTSKGLSFEHIDQNWGPNV